MDGPSALVTSGAGACRARAAHQPRQHYRHLVSPLAYVRIDHANGGIIRDLSESGMAIQAVAPLRTDQVVHLRFDLLRPRVRIETIAKVTWAEPSGQAGLLFLDLPATSRRVLKDWLLVTLLAAARELSLRQAPIFKNRGEADSEAENLGGLIVSAAPLPAIHLAPPEPPVKAVEAQIPLIEEDATQEMPVRLSWWPADISPRTLASFVDTLIVTSAVLLFEIVFVATAGTLPSWLALFAITVGVAGTFGLIYQYLFETFCGRTLGRHLAQVAAEDLHWTKKTDPDTPRFR
jgi:PilZ domain/RDD family